MDVLLSAVSNRASVIAVLGRGAGQRMGESDGG